MIEVNREQLEILRDEIQESLLQQYQELLSLYYLKAQKYGVDISQDPTLQAFKKMLSNTFLYRTKTKVLLRQRGENEKD